MRIFSYFALGCAAFSTSWVLLSLDRFGTMGMVGAVLILAVAIILWTANHGEINLDKAMGFFFVGAAVAVGVITLVDWRFLTDNTPTLAIGMFIFGLIGCYFVARGERRLE